MLGQGLRDTFCENTPLEIEGSNIANDIAEMNENVVADHARQVTRMLPGGMYVLGIFIVSPEDLLSSFSPKIRSIVSTLHKQLGANTYLYGNTSSEKLVLNYCTNSRKYFCKCFDVTTFSVQHADFKFVPKALKWVSIECDLEVNYLKHLKTEADWPLQKHVQEILKNLNDSLNVAVYLFDEEFKDNNENVEVADKKKTRNPRSPKSDSKALQGSSKSIRVSIFLGRHPNAPDSYSIHETCGDLRIVGQVACKLWVQPSMIIKEVKAAIKQDIMRSLAARLEMHWDSLTEEENSEDLNCVHEPPRRVLIELPNSNVTLSDYLFPGEGAQDAKTSLEELLDIKITGKLKLLDLEGQADISNYYDGASDSDSKELLQTLGTNSNKLVYGSLLIAMLVLVISVILHFYKY